MKFKAKKDRFTSYVFLLTTIIIVASFLLLLILEAPIPFAVLLLLPVIQVYLIWVWFDTTYGLTEGVVFYRNGPLRGKIPLSEIKKIGIGESMWTGKKPALARGGLILHYKDVKQIYIAPERWKQMVTEMVKLNPNIEIMDLQNKLQS